MFYKSLVVSGLELNSAIVIAPNNVATATIVIIILIFLDAVGIIFPTNPRLEQFQ